MKKTSKVRSESSRRVPSLQKLAVKTGSPGIRPEVKAALQESFVKFDGLYRALAKSGG